MLQQKIGREKTRVIKRINELVAPRMWESGYRTGRGSAATDARNWDPLAARLRERV